MAAASEAAFDTERLSGELAHALEAEDKYHRVNEMKKRAITTAASYDEFKNLVACAADGLKPVSGKELQEDLLRSKPFSFGGTTTAHGAAATKAVEAERAVRAGAGGRRRLGRKRPAAASVASAAVSVAAEPSAAPEAAP
ncbi:hypothetical protein FNF29_01509 [Cafeteria roenbergensis]|uniref:Dynein attachment factor N-terminal domain-containing protein n=1 Tax=Cafeteria roenbergensis TaxID=33653 RepID=A0A5A8CR69_CAFRO|nr:hypothetical protein FNF29_01509 [Cafeteria roenbergensis]|eukprot:KAA0155592.1 hypothetical protein FNF29_01509 [Cafeteria roenbergensis]